MSVLQIKNSFKPIYFDLAKHVSVSPTRGVATNSGLEEGGGGGGGGPVPNRDLLFIVSKNVV